MAGRSLASKRPWPRPTKHLPLMQWLRGVDNASGAVLLGGSSRRLAAFRRQRLPDLLRQGSTGERLLQKKCPRPQPTVMVDHVIGIARHVQNTDPGSQTAYDLRDILAGHSRHDQVSEKQMERSIEFPAMFFYR